MNKEKYIERKSDYRHSRVDRKYKKLKHRFVDENTILPYKESMRKRSGSNNLSWDAIFLEHGFYNYKHIHNLLKERIGYDWDIVFREILSKLRKKKYEREYKPQKQWFGFYIELDIFFNDDDLPIQSSGRLLTHTYFVDENNIISYYDSKEKLIKEYDKRIRKKKLLRLLESL